MPFIFLVRISAIENANTLIVIILTIVNIVVNPKACPNFCEDEKAFI